VKHGGESVASSDEEASVVSRLIEDFGHFTRSLGLGRAIGQIYAFLYFSPEPRGLANMQEHLGVSRGSASMTVRQLEQWGAVRKVWVKGDRKDYYEANDWLGQIVRNVLTDTIGKRLAGMNGIAAGVGSDLTGVAEQDRDFVQTRIENLERFQRRVRNLWESPIVQRLLR